MNIYKTDNVLINRKLSKGFLSCKSRNLGLDSRVRGNDEHTYGNDEHTYGNDEHTYGNPNKTEKPIPAPKKLSDTYIGMI